MGSNGTLTASALPGPPPGPRCSIAGVQYRYLAAAARLHDIPRFGDLAIAVGVQHLAAPAHGLLFIVGLVVHLGVDPAEDGAGQLVEIQGLVRIVVELQMMRGKTRIDQRELARFRVEVGGLPPAVAEREPIGEFVARIAAPCRILVAADLRRHPNTALAVEHGIVRIGGIVGRVRPQMFHAPEHRGAIGSREARRDFIPGFARRECPARMCCSRPYPKRPVDRDRRSPHSYGRPR